MTNNHWPAEAYAIGSYIQTTAADEFLPKLSFKEKDKVLDIGCGEGHYSLKILKKIPKGHLTGIDTSENMLKLAKEKASQYLNFQVKKADVTKMDFNEEFDVAVSFWCLQWVSDIHLAFENIYKALRKGGKLLILFPSGDDPFMSCFHQVKDSGAFKELKHFKPPMNYEQFHDLHTKLNDIPFQYLNITHTKRSMTLPSLDVFRKFVNGLGFFQGQISSTKIPQINEALVQCFAKMAKERYKGEYRFNYGLFEIEGAK